MPERLLSRHAPGAAVARDEEGERDLRALLGHAAAIAAQLASGDFVLAVEDRYALAAALLAALSTGRVVVFPPNNRPATVARVAAERGLAVVHDGVLPSAPAGGGLDLAPLVRASPAEPLVWRAPDPDRLVVSLCTSGSTGPVTSHPKTAGQLLGEAAMLAAKFGVYPGQCVMGTVPPHHVYGLLFSVLMPLAGGGVFVRRSPLHPADIANQARTLAVDLLVTTPAHLRALADHGEALGVRALVSSGAPLDPALGTRACAGLGVPITEVLGSTETGGLAWRDVGGDGSWRPLPGVSVEVDANGHMLVDSPYLPPRSERPARTSELVELVEGGFRHLGRADDVVKVAGKRVSVGEISAALRGLVGVEDAELAPREVSGGRGVELVALVVAPGRSAEGLRADLERRFDPTVVPRVFRHVPEIDRGARGKLSREEVLGLVDAAPVSVWNFEQLGQGSGPTRGGERIVLELGVPRASSWFRGHFPGYPVVPGAILLQIASVRARVAWVRLGELSSVQRLKFKRPIGPGDRVQLKVDHVPGSLRADFAYTAAGELCAQGTLIFAEAAP